VARPKTKSHLGELEVGALLDGLGPATRQLVSALRKVIRRTIPQAEESLLWGGISYHRPQVGGRVKGAVCQIVFKDDRVRLDFIHGVRLQDPSGLLRGNRLSKRYVPIEAGRRNARYARSLCGSRTSWP
jgi:hypothetical protein